MGASWSFAAETVVSLATYAIEAITAAILCIWQRSTVCGSIRLRQHISTGYSVPPSCLPHTPVVSAHQSNRARYSIAVIYLTDSGPSRARQEAEKLTLRHSNVLLRRASGGCRSTHEGLCTPTSGFPSLMGQNRRRLSGLPRCSWTPVARSPYSRLRGNPRHHDRLL